MLRLLHSHARLHCGPRAGDMCRPSDSDILAEVDGCCDGLISGFPCLPFSDMGSNKGTSDARSLPMWIVIRWIVLLATSAGLSWFMLENVPGILKRKKGQDSFATWLMARLKRSLEEAGCLGWEARIQTHNSKSCFLPQ